MDKEQDTMVDWQVCNNDLSCKDNIAWSHINLTKRKSRNYSRVPYCGWKVSSSFGRQQRQQKEVEDESLIIKVSKPQTNFSGFNC
ncbi:hypothetical protein Leryth_008115 [Lithospermum erythrorhizon]|nr:hypothetical protein Leryth_008115 [Lithospermum erythrorhizon]